MPYFPTVEESQYFCPNCRGWFYSSNVSCLVYHVPGSCCHYYESSAPGPGGVTVDVRVTEPSETVINDDIGMCAMTKKAVAYVRPESS
jgi:hypothetical protein